MPKPKAAKKSPSKKFHPYQIELILDDTAVKKIKAYAVHIGWKDLISRGQKLPKGALTHQLEREAIEAAIYHFLAMVAEHPPLARP